MICLFPPINDWAPDAYATTVKAIRLQINCRDEFTMWVQMLIFSMSFGSHFHTSRGGKSWYWNLIVTVKELLESVSAIHSHEYTNCQEIDLHENFKVKKITKCQWWGYTKTVQSQGTVQSEGQCHLQCEDSNIFLLSICAQPLTVFSHTNLFPHIHKLERLPHITLQA